ncbi:MAG: molybdenum cofactor biosynthesis protein MoaE [Mucilaginibacter polytrichastri]|nr:molybdenum cofactor biosynthesis protein MoaE [Mucilaginibacter polytrichastri]
MLIKLVEHIDLNEAHRFLQHPEAGAVNIFVGTVRNHAQQKAVQKLAFEAYPEMAIREMEKIVNAAAARWPLKEVLIIHALGEKAIGEPVVVTGASAAHREAAFEACRFLIDELKKTVPIWKKEFYDDKSVWINAHP